MELKCKIIHYSYKKCNLFQKWSQIKHFSTLTKYEPTTKQRLSKILKDLNNIEEFNHLPTFLFILSWKNMVVVLSHLFVATAFKPASLYFVRRTWKSTFSMLKGCISYSSCHVKTSIYCLWVVSYFLDVLCVAFHEPTFHQTWMTPILFCISSPYQVLLLFHSIVLHNSKRKISNTYSRKRLCFKYLYKFYSYLLYLNKREELQF